MSDSREKLKYLLIPLYHGPGTSDVGAIPLEAEFLDKVFAVSEPLSEGAVSSFKEDLNKVRLLTAPQRDPTTTLPVEHEINLALEDYSSATCDERLLSLFSPSDKELKELVIANDHLHLEVLDSSGYLLGCLKLDFRTLYRALLEEGLATQAQKRTYWSTYASKWPTEALKTLRELDNGANPEINTLFTETLELLDMRPLLQGEAITREERLEAIQLMKDIREDEEQKASPSRSPRHR